MRTDISALITTIDKESQYDTQAKKLLSRKIILAHILKNTIEEFDFMSEWKMGSPRFL